MRLRVRHILAGLEPACPSVCRAAKYYEHPFRHRCAKCCRCQLAFCCQLFADPSTVLHRQCWPQPEQYKVGRQTSYQQPVSKQTRQMTVFQGLLVCNAILASDSGTLHMSSVATL